MNRFVLLLSILMFMLASCSNPAPAPSTETRFVCPVTDANGSMPPGDTIPSSTHHGNGKLWVELWPDGITIIPSDQIRPDGKLAMKYPWWRAVTGRLVITGRRLDAESPPLEAVIPEGYGETGFQASGLIFPSEGCWEIIGEAAGATLKFVTLVVKG